MPYIITQIQLDVTINNKRLFKNVVEKGGSSTPPLEMIIVIFTFVMSKSEKSVNSAVRISNIYCS